MQAQNIVKVRKENIDEENEGCLVRHILNDIKACTLDKKQVRKVLLEIIQMVKEITTVELSYFQIKTQYSKHINGIISAKKLGLTYLNQRNVL